MVTFEMKSEVRLLENFLLLGEAGLFVLLQPSTGWMRPTHIMESNLLSPSPQTKRPSHPKHSPRWHIKLTIGDIRSKPRSLPCGARMDLPSPAPTPYIHTGVHMYTGFGDERAGA